MKKNISINLPIELITELPTDNRSKFIESAIRLKLNQPSIEQQIISLINSSLKQMQFSPIQHTNHINNEQKNKASQFQDALSSIISMRE